LFADISGGVGWLNFFFFGVREDRVLPIMSKLTNSQLLSKVRDRLDTMMCPRRLLGMSLILCICFVLGCVGFIVAQLSCVPQQASESVL
jgi:predicted PurR-regulated permease PerM